MREQPRVDEAAVRLLAEKYPFNPDVTGAAGTIGARQGRETGASVEIQDFRDYVPGDDPRRIDWMAFGRTERLVVRLFREEVSPFFDILIDTSASMALEDGRKGALVAEICHYLYHSARSGGILARLFSAGEGIRRLEHPDQLQFGPSRSVLFTRPRVAMAGMRRAAVRMVISDFMDPAEPSAVIRAAAAGCARLVVLQILGPWEADPPTEGPVTLNNVETGGQRDVHINHRTLQQYNRRLQALEETVREETLKCGGIPLKVVAESGLEEVLRAHFVPCDLVDMP